MDLESYGLPEFAQVPVQPGSADVAAPSCIPGVLDEDAGDA